MAIRTQYCKERAVATENCKKRRSWRVSLSFGNKEVITGDWVLVAETREDAGKESPIITKKLIFIECLLHTKHYSNNGGNIIPHFADEKTEAWGNLPKTTWYEWRIQDWNSRGLAPEPKHHAVKASEGEGIGPRAYRQGWHCPGPWVTQDFPSRGHEMR